MPVQQYISSVEFSVDRIPFVSMVSPHSEFTLQFFHRNLDIARALETDGDPGDLHLVKALRTAA